MLKRVIVLCLLFCFTLSNVSVIAQTDTKYPDYSTMFLGKDKWENYNRKMFNFNLRINRYALRPLHVIWSSILPKYGIDRLHGISDNIEFPIRLVSSLIQKDFTTSKNETIRFFTNTILGLGGMYDPAKKFFHIEKSNENMEQALAGCKVKPGQYFVFPILSFVSPRGLVGKLLDVALNPGSYIASPVLAIIKAGLTLNKTSYLQPWIALVESTFPDPYDIAKKIYALDTHIKCQNLDRVEIASQLRVPVDEVVKNENETSVVSMKRSSENAPNILAKMEVYSKILDQNMLFGGAIKEQEGEVSGIEEIKLEPDISLVGYNPQTPVIDSMRTSLFQDEKAFNSIWNELSLWNRSFNNRIKVGKIAMVDNRPLYSYKYILQKKVNKSPLVVIFPSIGESVNSEHSVVLAKMFYDKGYSVVILGSHFHWEFVNSMEVGYAPGMPAKDAKLLQKMTAMIISNLSNKYKYKFGEKVVIGTSFGALETLFLASEEYRNNLLGEARFISICPPVDLIYAMKQVDKISQGSNFEQEDMKNRISLAAAKIVKFFTTQDEIDFEINNLPFNDEDGKLITAFVMHQKLSDLVFVLEKTPTNKRSEIYDLINNMSFEDYVKRYILTDKEDDVSDIAYSSSLYSISDYLENSNNYKIYHAMNDYLTNISQLKRLKMFAQDKMVLLDNGAHLGFLYRKEFIEDLSKTISLDKLKEPQDDKLSKY